MYTSPQTNELLHHRPCLPAITESELDPDLYTPRAPAILCTYFVNRRTRTFQFHLELPAGANVPNEYPRLIRQ